MDGNTGAIVISLDTELAWGLFDKGEIAKYENAYRNTPEVIDQLCDLFDKYEISATWAIVSHLLKNSDCDHSDRTSPEFEWVGNWFDDLPCAIGLDDDLWYAPWLINRLHTCKTEQEIGLHGSTHIQLGADGCSRQNAEEEIQDAVETLHAYGVEPKSFVYPRNNIGHIDVLREHGIEAYRGVNGYWYERADVLNAVKPPLRFADEAARRSPPIVDPVDRDGIVEVPGSQTFRPSYDGWQYTPGESSVARAKKGIRRASQTGGVFHLWFHPFNFGHNISTDLSRLERVLEFSKEYIDKGKLKSTKLSGLVDL